MTKQNEYRLIESLMKNDSINKKADILGYLPQIREAENLGYSKKGIWEQLVKDKKIKCSYRYFLLVVNGHKENKKNASPSKKAKGVPSFDFESHAERDNLI